MWSLDIHSLLRTNALQIETTLSPVLMCNNCTQQSMFLSVALGDSGRHFYILILLVSFLTFSGLKSYDSGTFPVNSFKIELCTLVMKQLAARFRSSLQSSKEHVMKRNKVGLEPKLMSNVQLSSECKESVRKEIEELKDFLKFYKNLATGNVVRI